jgi:hypothetical protein
VEYVAITAFYTDTSGVRHDRILREVEHIGEYVVDGVVSYLTPSDYNDAGVIFHLIVRNEHGLIYTEEVTLVENSIEAHFNRWEDSLLPDITNNSRDFVVVGENIRYYVDVSANSEPSSVKINGIAATKSGEFLGSSVSNTTWYIPWSSNAKGSYPMEVEVVSGNKSATIPMRDIVVYGLKIGERTTTIDTSGQTMYMLQNAGYTSTYMTSTGTTLAANTSQNYYNLFTIEGGYINSIARDAYMTGTNGNVSFGSGTSYTIAKSGSNIRISYRSGWSTYNMRQTSNTAIGLSTSSSNRNWNLYPVTYDIP